MNVITQFCFQKSEFEATLDFHIQYHDQNVIQRNLVKPSMFKKTKEITTSNTEAGHLVWNGKLGNVFLKEIKIYSHQSVRGKHLK